MCFFPSSFLCLFEEYSSNNNNRKSGIQLALNLARCFWCFHLKTHCKLLENAANKTKIRILYDICCRWKYNVKHMWNENAVFKMNKHTKSLILWIYSNENNDFFCAKFAYCIRTTNAIVFNFSFLFSAEYHRISFCMCACAVHGDWRVLLFLCRENKCIFGISLILNKTGNVYMYKKFIDKQRIQCGIIPLFVQQERKIESVKMNRMCEIENLIIFSSHENALASEMTCRIRILGT